MRHNPFMRIVILSASFAHAHRSSPEAVCFPFSAQCSPALSRGSPPSVSSSGGSFVCGYCGPQGERFLRLSASLLLTHML